MCYIELNYFKCYSDILIIMQSAHRTAFQPKLNKTPLDFNLDQIIHISQVKLKEFIAKKENIEAKTNVLIGKNELLIKEIEHIHSQIQNRQSMLESLEKEFISKQNELSIVNENIKKLIEEYRINEANYKTQMNKLNNRLNSIKNGTIAEESSQKFEVKKKCEELLHIQNENGFLKEKLYRLNLQLYQYEIAKRDSNVNENTNAIKAQNGIQMISELYK